MNQFLTSLVNIREELEIVSGAGDTCVACKGPKEPLNAAHGDSSAMFDEVLETKEDASYRRMRRRVEAATGCVSVTLQRTGKHRSWPTALGRRGEDVDAVSAERVICLRESNR